MPRYVFRQQIIYYNLLSFVNPIRLMAFFGPYASRKVRRTADRKSLHHVCFARYSMMSPTDKESSSGMSFLEVKTA